MVYRILLLLLIGVASPTWAGEVGPARSALEAFADGLETFQTAFTQTVRSQDGMLQDQTSGRLWLQVPDRLRWEYAGDFPETIVADGVNIWIHDVTLEQVTVKPQSDQASDSPLLVLADITRLDEQFSVTELGEFEDMALLELRSLDAESEFERVLLGFGEEGVRMMAMEDAFGQRTEVQFMAAARNEPLDAGLFTFTPPAGADVVGDPRFNQ
jgi:outer membrane lipoprotein carrier protein